MDLAFISGLSESKVDTFNNSVPLPLQEYVLLLPLILCILQIILLTVYLAIAQHVLFYFQIIFPSKTLAFWKQNLNFWITYQNKKKFKPVY